LQRRADGYIPDADGKWELTGGRMEFGEKPEETVMRECLEEIGCEVRILRLVPHIQSNMWERSDGTTAQALVMCYEVEIIKGEPKPIDPKVAEVEWFSADEISSVDILPGIEKFIEAIK
jgi:8-oxo-dGTP diphosphatase